MSVSESSAKLTINGGTVVENGADAAGIYWPSSGSLVVNDGYIEAIFTEANKWLGTPYEMPPNMPTTFDCSGFVWYVFQQMHCLR